MENRSDPPFSLSTLTSPLPPRAPQDPTSQRYWEITQIIFLYILPIQVLFGCCGNIMNLLVLLHRKMRSSRTNLLFAAMAFTDLAFLIASLQSTLVMMIMMKQEKGSLKPENGGLQLPDSVAQVVRNYKHIPNGLCNWFSAMSIFFMIYATVERVSVIRSPFRISKKPASIRFVASILLIGIVTLSLTGIHFFPQTQRLMFPQLHSYWIMTQAITIIIVPFFLTTVLNFMLIMELKKNKCQMHALNDNNSASTQQLIMQRARCERKVTFMVFVISTAFIVCNLPGCIWYLSKTFHLGAKMILVEAICNQLAITGKVLNFILFCSSSQHFRALLRERIKNWKYCWSSKHTRRSSSKMGHSQTGRTLSVPLTDI